MGFDWRWLLPPGSRALGPPETSLNGWALDSVTRVAGAAAGATPGFMPASQPAWSFPGAHTTVCILWALHVCERRRADMGRCAAGPTVPVIDALAGLQSTEVCSLSLHSADGDTDLNKHNNAHNANTSQAIGMFLQ